MAASLSKLLKMGKAEKRGAPRYKFFFLRVLSGYFHSRYQYHFLLFGLPFPPTFDKMIE
jgi:hypothetical protein